MANDQSKINKQAILSLFGQFFGNRLLNLIGACCSSIVYAFTVTCSGDPKNPYTIMEAVTYGSSIPGTTVLFVNAYLQPLTSAVYQKPVASAVAMIQDIVAGQPVITFDQNEAGLPSPPGSTLYVYLADNHGNAAEPVKVVLPSC